LSFQGGSPTSRKLSQCPQKRWLNGNMRIGWIKVQAMTCIALEMMYPQSSGAP
jgi:hypothetical protein